MSKVITAHDAKYLIDNKLFEKSVKLIVDAINDAIVENKYSCTLDISLVYNDILVERIVSYFGKLGYAFEISKKDLNMNVFLDWSNPEVC